MSEPVGLTGIALAIKALFCKLPFAPWLIGVLGACVGFLFFWPKTKKEGISRIIVSGMSSHFFGETVLRTIIKFADWIQPDEMRAGAYLLAAVPAWWILGAWLQYLNKGKDIKEIAQDVKEIV